VSMPYRLERRSRAVAPSFVDLYQDPASPEWVTVALFESHRHPNALGMRGANYGDQVRVMRNDTLVDVYEWTARVPLNPGDISCTDFEPGWRLIKRENTPVPTSDELAHFFQMT
jgi:hypothetical protein